MKRTIVFSCLAILALAIFVSAVAVEIKPIQSKSLSSGNNVCEYYHNEFSTGEKDIITVNGATLNVEYLGNKEWKVNDYQGTLVNHDFFVNNKNSKLKGVRFDFSFMDQYQPEGNLGLTEQDYYPWDCQGYSQSTGFVSTINIKEGWNLVPFDISLRDCSYALEGELCKEDILVSYLYIPSLNKYMTEQEIQKNQNDPAIRNYFSEENEFSLQKSSKWIYIKPGIGNKKVIGHFGAYIPYRNQYLDQGTFKLKSGWNFLFVDAFMVYDDSWNENPLSLSDIKGDCTIQNVYRWDYFSQKWTPLNEEFDDDMVGDGFVVKVANDCTLKYNADISNPPTLP